MAARGSSVSLSSSKGKEKVDIPEKESDLSHPDECSGLWRLVGVLGSGSLGDIYQGINLTTGKGVVIKRSRWINKRGKAQDPRRMHAIACTEASIMAYLTAHKCSLCVEIIEDCFKTKNDLWIIMEHLNSMAGWIDLRKYMRKTGNFYPWSVKARIILALKIGEALEMIHSLGVIHRDLKPANIMYNERSRKIKLIDFGLACADSENIESILRFSPSGCSDELIAHRLHCPNVSAGTPRYIHPRRRTRDPKPIDNPYILDSYSFIMILHEIFRPADINMRLGLAELTDADNYDLKKGIFRDDIKKVPPLGAIMAELRKYLEYLEEPEIAIGSPIIFPDASSSSSDWDLSSE